MEKVSPERTTKSFSSHPFTVASIAVVLFCFCCCCCFCFLFVFAFLVHILFSLFVALIISSFYCFNYTSVLLHPITKHSVSHLSLSFIIFIITTLIIGFFYCINYTLLLFHFIVTRLIDIFYNNYVNNINICPRQLLRFINISLILY